MGANSSDRWKGNRSRWKIAAARSLQVRQMEMYKYLWRGCHLCITISIGLSITDLTTCNSWKIGDAHHHHCHHQHHLHYHHHHHQQNSCSASETALATSAWWWSSSSPLTSLTRLRRSSRWRCYQFDSIKDLGFEMRVLSKFLLWRWGCFQRSNPVAISQQDGAE